MRSFFPPMRWAAGVLSVAAILMGSTGSARADLLPVLDSVTPSGSNFVFKYHVNLPANSSINGNGGPSDFLTMYDFAGYVAGSAAVVPVGTIGTWAKTEQFLGINPSGISPTDSASLLNITFQYTTNAQVLGPVIALTFTLTSTLGNIAGTFTPYAASSTNTQNGSLQGNFGFVQGPNPVPEPGTMVLMGIGSVLCLGYAHRHRRRAA